MIHKMHDMKLCSKCRQQMYYGKAGYLDLVGWSCVACEVFIEDEDYDYAGEK